MNSEEKVNQKSFEKSTSEQYFKQTILQSESNKQKKPTNSALIFSIMKSPAFVGKIFFLVDGITQHQGYFKRERVNRLTSCTAVKKYILNKNNTTIYPSISSRGCKSSQGTVFPRSAFFTFQPSNLCRTSVLFSLLTSCRLVLHLSLILLMPLFKDQSLLL